MIFPIYNVYTCTNMLHLFFQQRGCLACFILGFTTSVPDTLTDHDKVKEQSQKTQPELCRIPPDQAGVSDSK